MATQRDNLPPVVIIGGDSDEILYGQGDGDLLLGGGGDDTLVGGFGNDRLGGGSGKNTYVFGRGDGQDTVTTSDSPAPARDVLRFGDGIGAADIVLARSGDALELSIRDTQDRVTVAGYFATTAGGGPGLDGPDRPGQPLRLGEIRFADGSAWRYENVLARLDPVLALDGASNVATGHHLDGGAGDDQLTAVADGWLRGGAGNDTLRGSTGHDLIEGGDGDDLLVGGAGVDTYRFSGNWGHDTLDLHPEAGLRASIIDMSGHSSAALAFDTDGADLIVSVIGSDQTLRVARYFAAGDTSIAENLRLALADGVVMDQALIRKALDASYFIVLGTSGGDQLLGWPGTDLMKGGLGNDLLDGGAGNDLLFGGEGNDTLLGGEGNDELDAGPGNADLDGGAGVNLYAFGRDAGIYSVRAAPAGKHIMLLDADVRPGDLRVASRDGMLEVSIDGTGAVARLPFGDLDAGANQAMPVLLRFADGAEWDGDILLSKLLHGDAADNTLSGGPSLDILDGMQGNDLLDGAGGNDTVRGGDGNDTLDGGRGDDVQNGGSGDDSFVDAFGNNTYLFSRGDGHDLIAGAARQAGASNVIEFAAGIAPQDVSLRIVANAASGNADLIVAIGSERITVASWQGKGVAVAPLSGIGFADGTFWKAESFSARTLIGDGGDNLLTGTAANDVLEGWGGNDTLAGADGNDTLWGGDGNDTLEGGAGRDTLWGGDGNDDLQGGSDFNLIHGGRGDDILRGTRMSWDTFVFNKGDGSDTLVNPAYGTVISFGPGIVASDIVPVNVAPSMSFVYGGSDSAPDRVIVPGDGGQFDNLKVRFADNKVLPLSHFIRHAPQVDAGMYGFAVQEGESTALPIPENAFSDVDAGDVLRYDLRTEQGGTLPAWLSFDADARVILLSPGYRDAGDVELTLTATDTSGQSASTNFTLQVFDRLVAPVAGTPVPDQTVEEQRPFSLVLPSDLFIDEDDDGAGVLTVGALPAWLHFDAPTRTLSGTPATPGAGPVAIEFTLTDSAGASATTSFNLEVAVAGSIALRGTAQADILHGKSNDDNLAGLGGNDQLYGHLGNDVLDGGAGRDTLAGGAGNDSYLADAQDVIIEEADAGLDQISSAVGLGLPAHVEILTLTGRAAVDGRGNGLDNVIKGNAGANHLRGLEGADLLQGGAGNDTVSDTAGQANLFDGGAGNDRLNGGDGNELFFGGKGADIIDTGTGADLIVFNRGNGMDTVAATSGSDNIVSLGGGIAYADLVLRKAGSELVLSAGAGDQITFKGWYAGGGHASVSVLQMVTSASADYVPGSGSPLHDHKVEAFNFSALIAHFDQLRPASGNSWRVGTALEQFAIGGSDTSAIGGDLAYQYGLHGNLAQVGSAPAIAIVGSAGFANNWMTLSEDLSLNDGSPLLY